MKKTKEEALSVYGKQYSGMCSNCGNYGYKFTDQECQENKGEDNTEKSTKESNYKGNKKKAFDVIKFHFVGHGDRIADCKKHGKKMEKLEKSEKVEKAFDDMGDYSTCAQ